MEEMQDAKQVLADFKLKGKKRAKKTRLMGSLGFAQQAQNTQPPAAAGSYPDGPPQQQQSDTQPPAAAAGSYPDGPPQQQQSDTQPSAAAASHPDGPLPEQSQGPALVEEALENTNARGLWRWITIAIFCAIGIVSVAMLYLQTLGADGSMSRDPHLQESGNYIPALSEHRPVIRLYESVDIPGLSCLAGRVLPLSNLSMPEVTEAPMLISDIFTMLKDLSDAEEKVVSRLHSLRDRATEIKKRRVEICSAPRNQSPNTLARVKAIRDIQSLVAQLKQLREDIKQLKDDIRQQKDGLIPRLTTKVQSYCSKVQEPPLKEFYRTQIWGDSGQDGSAPEEHKRLALLHRGFCSTVQSVLRSTSQGPRQGSALSAVREAGELHKLVNKELDEKTGPALQELNSGCGLFCSVIRYSYEVLLGEAAASPSH